MSLVLAKNSRVMLEAVPIATAPATNLLATLLQFYHGEPMHGVAAVDKGFHIQYVFMYVCSVDRIQHCLHVHVQAAGGEEPPQEHRHGVGHHTYLYTHTYIHTIQLLSPIPPCSPQDS